MSGESESITQRTLDGITDSKSFFPTFCRICSSITVRQWESVNQKSVWLYCAWSIWQFDIDVCEVYKMKCHVGSAYCWVSVLRFMSQEARVSSCAAQGFQKVYSLVCFRNFRTFNSFRHEFCPSPLNDPLSMVFLGHSETRGHVVSYPSQQHCFNIPREKASFTLDLAYS